VPLDIFVNVKDEFPVVQAPEEVSVTEQDDSANEEASYVYVVDKAVMVYVPVKLPSVGSFHITGA
jgi:hypothetical protein